MTGESRISGDSQGLEAALAAQTQAQYRLRLFVTGGTYASLRAVSNLRHICEHYLTGRYDLTVVDIRQQPALCVRDQIVAAPTLVRESPLPALRLVGDFSDAGSVVAGLGLPAGTGTGAL